MSIVSVNQIYNNRTGGIDSTGKSTFVRNYVVETSSATDDADLVRAAVTVDIGDAYSGSTDAVCVRKQATAESEKVWTVRVEYESLSVDSQAADKPTGGSEIPDPVIRWSALPVERTFFEDVTDPTPKKYINSAGDPLENIEPATVYYRQLDIQRYETTFDEATFDYLSCVNDNTFFGKPANSTLMTDLQAEFDFTYNKYLVRYQFVYNPYLWIPKKILDAGFNHIVGGVKKRIMIDEVPTATPRLLDGSGGLGTQPVFLDFVEYYSANFGQLNLE